MEQIAANFGGYSPYFSMANRADCSRISGKYRFDEFMTLSSQDMKSLVKSGRLTGAVEEGFGQVSSSGILTA